MALSCFDDKTHQPSDPELAAALGRAHPLWQGLERIVLERVPAATREWGYSNEKAGWSLRLKHKTRVLVYMVPCRGHVLASTALGEKAVARAHERRLPQAFLDVLDAAPRYPEGRGIRLDLRRKSDLDLASHLIALKTER